MINRNSIHFIRHATMVITINGVQFLVDPMLSPKDELDPVQHCGNQTRFPMVGLPISNGELNTLINEVDAIVITHMHRDHWDATAQRLISKNKPVFCQPVDREKIKEQGFKNVIGVDSNIIWEGISISRTNGKHGTGEIGQKMGEVSGFVFVWEDLSVYVAGDTIWCEEVESALIEFNPKTTILNAGGAKFLTGDPITMTPGDVQKVYQKHPHTHIIAVHMDTVNHCFIKRSDLAKALAGMNPGPEIIIPKDGELIVI